MKITYNRVFLQDQIRGFGCGWRTLFAIHGRKWVRVVDWQTGVSKRILKSVWGSLHPEELPGWDRKRVRKRLRLVSGDTGPSRHIKAVMKAHPPPPEPEDRP